MGQPFINPDKETSIKIFGLANTLNRPLSDCKDEQERKELSERKAEALVYFDQLGEKLDDIKKFNKQMTSLPRDSVFCNTIKSL